MDKNKIVEEIRKLVEDIEEHNHNYYNLNNPTISDYEYDCLLDSLIKLETEYPDLVLKHSPTQRAGIMPDSQLKRVNHVVPFYSLDKVHSIEDIGKWMAKVEKRLRGNKYND